MLGLARKSLFLMSGLGRYAAHAQLGAESRSSVNVAEVGRCLAHALYTERDVYLRVYTAYTLFRAHRDVHKLDKKAP